MVPIEIDDYARGQGLQIPKVMIQRGLCGYETITGTMRAMGPELEFERAGGSGPTTTLLLNEQEKKDLEKEGFIQGVIHNDLMRTFFPHVPGQNIPVLVGLTPYVEEFKQLHKWQPGKII